MSTSRGWTTPADLAAKVRRRWDDRSLLQAFARDEPFPEFSLPVKGPRPSQIGDDLTAVRDWIATLEAGAPGRYELIRGSVGGRAYGRNQVPTRAIVSSFDQAWRLLSVRSEVADFLGVLEIAGDVTPVRDWVIAHPHRAIGLAEEFTRVRAAHDWFDRHRGSGRRLREISAPGVDTKFAEEHRNVLASMLGVSSAPTKFLTDLGLATKPLLVRLRLRPDSGPSWGLPAVSELALRTGELAALELRPSRVLVVENETTYLSVPIPRDGIVVWGKGFEVDRLGRIDWLSHSPVDYWGDLDTHGFSILNLLRSRVPHTRSVLMDLDTLLAHRDRWVVEDRPNTARLSHLTDAERAVHAALVEDHHGERVRLEQELIDWPWVLDRLTE